MWSNEIWKDVKDFQGVYQISSLGRLKSFKINPNGYITSQKNSKGGYLSVVLISGKKIKYTRIHRIVAKHFIDNPERKKQVNHINGIKSDNRVENLEWVTPKENVAHAINMNPNILKGINNYNNRRRVPILQFTLNGNFIKKFPCGTEASIETGVCERNIYQVAAKTEYKKGLTRKQAGGFIWKYETI